jgi:hypothetical protein
MKTQVKALLYHKTGEIIFSRARHDYRTTEDGKCFIDGGFEYTRSGGDLLNYDIIVIEIDQSTSELFNDWNTKADKYGYISPEEAKKVKILDKKDIYDEKSMEYKLMTAIWGTNGPKGDQPRKYVNLMDCETDHLLAILKNCGHISDDYRQIINYILMTREIEGRDTWVYDKK